jgi:hypothetical protein
LSGYKSWLEKQCEGHAKIVEKLLEKGYDKAQIIDYFEYENMRKSEVDFCPLYKDNTKCHDTQYLNCYLCACPNFRFSDLGFQRVDGVEYSNCGINSKDGIQKNFDGQIHQDCSKCIVPHEKKYITKHFDESLEKIMKNCDLSVKN